MTARRTVEVYPAAAPTRNGQSSLMAQIEIWVDGRVTHQSWLMPLEVARSRAAAMAGGSVVRDHTLELETAS